MNGLWNQRPVFITGCSGFLGSWLTQELLACGADVIGLVRDWTQHSRLVTEGFRKRMTIVNGGVDDIQMLERTLNEYNIDTVFHLAAQTQVTLANRHPLSTLEVNVRGTWNMLEACRRVGCAKRIVVASSDKAYGYQARLPIEETSPLQGKHPYDVSKSCADLIAQSYFHTYGLPVCITRFGNLFGGGDMNFQRLVPGTIQSVLRGERPVIRSDGTFVRDYIYVRDAALAYISLADRMLERGLAGEAFNFSLEKPLSAREMVDLVLDRMGCTNLECEVLNQGQNEIPMQMLSARKAREVLGWCPRYALEAALDETIKWYRACFQETGK